MTESNTNFASQEYFTLACVGFEKETLDNLPLFINNLKKRYKIQNPKLKSANIKHIFGKKVGFILELLKYIEEKSKILIEIVDKKYIISINIVNHLINPPYFNSNNQEEIQKLNLIFSQWVYQYIPNDFFINFSNTSRNPTEEGLENLFQNLLNIVKGINNELSEAIILAIKESVDDYQIIKNNESNYNRKAYTFFLPLPDYNKRNELIGMLPYISSFTSIHARLNYLYGNNLSLITIVHDNQSHFDDILKEYHTSALENNSFKKYFEFANYNFQCLSNLEFHDDANEIGLQIADIFAGFVNKAIHYITSKQNFLEDKEYKIVIQILTSLYFKKCINFVLPIEHSQNQIFPILENNINFMMKMSLLGINKDYIVLQNKI